MEPSFIPAPDDFRVEFWGYINEDGDSISFHLEYDGEGKYINSSIEVDNQGRVIESIRAGRAQKAYYYYGNDHLLDSITTGVESSYKIKYIYTHSNDEILSSIRESQVYFSEEVPRYDITNNIYYNQDIVTIERINNTDGSLIEKEEYTIGEGYSPFPKRYRLTNYWGSWGRDWGRHILENVYTNYVHYDSSGEIDNQYNVTYKYNQYGYPTGIEGGNVYYIYNYD